jgi:prevent-host-death family protein
MVKNASQVGIRALKNETSKILRRVRDGETIVISDRGHPFAVITPHTEAGPDPLVALALAGRVSWGGGKPMGSKRPAPLKGSADEASVAAAIIEDRR